MSYDRNKDGLRNDGSKGHVLIVDDAPFITKQLEAMLTEDGYKVVGKAHNGEDAISMYKEMFPDIDLVTLDVTMPKMDGVTTLEHLLAFDKDACIVIISSLITDSIIKKALALGARNFITKPIQSEKALPRLRNATRK